MAILTRKEILKKLRPPLKPSVIVGTGLLTLDVVLGLGEDLNSQMWAGGTCGNVLTIMSYLGWQSYPVARLNGDSAAKIVIDDLKKWGVHLDFARQSPTTSTPIIVQQIGQTAEGETFHKFTWTCPQCGAWLPAYKAILAGTASNISSTFPSADVFFFDRLSRGAINLAKECASTGALVIFEPSGLGDEKLFREALSIIHILKYSRERAWKFQHLIDSTRPLLEIETLGRLGLRYRSTLNQFENDTWENVDGYNAGEIKDAAGAGDWCTAGIIHSLGQMGIAGISGLSRTSFHEALKLGQAMAAWNCGFEGARGGMYRVAVTEFKNAVARILGFSGSNISQGNRQFTKVRTTKSEFCPTCHV